MSGAQGDVRNTELDHIITDPLYDSGFTGLTVTVKSNSHTTYVEVWRLSPGIGGARELVHHEHFQRRSDGPPEAHVLASYLARKVSAMDREGWPVLGS